MGEASESTPNPAPTLTLEEHAEIMKLDLKAIRTKVETGKPLTTPEIRRLDLAKAAGEPSVEAESDAPVWARSQVELATALGCERKTIQRYMKIDGNPGRTPDGRYLVSGHVRDLMSWKAWVQSRGSLKRSNETKDKNALECERLAKLNRDLDFDHAIKAGEYIHKSEVRKTFGEFGMVLKQQALAIPAQIAPDVVSLAIPEAEKLIRQHITRLLDHLAESPWSAPL